MAIRASLLLVAVAAGCAPTAVKITPVPADRSLKEVELQRDPGWVRYKVALIDVDGVIVNRPAPQLIGEGEHPVSLLVEKLDAARRDKAVKAAVLRINSPGGTVTACEMLYEEIRRFRRAGKPVVAMFMDVAASGGYYIACACDHIVAYPSSVTGSIGVIMHTVNVSGTMAKIGVEAQTIKSGPKKDAGSPFRQLQPEERAIFQGMIDDMFSRFVRAVGEARQDLSHEEVLRLADGRIYTAQQAQQEQLIDEIGTLRDAVARAKELAGLARCRLVTYQRPLSWYPNIYAQAAVGRPEFSMINIQWPSWLRPGGARFMYLWLPSLLE